MDTEIKAVKEQAKALQQALGEAGHETGYSQCLELISKTNGFSDWNTYCAHLKSNITATPQADNISTNLPISDLRRLSLIAKAPTCRLIVLIDDINPCDLIRHIGKNATRPGGGFFNIVYDKNESPAPAKEFYFGIDFTRHPISEDFPWKRALRAMEKASPDAVFLFHPPTAFYKEIDILACSRPAYVFMSKEEFLEVETYMRRFHRNLLLFKCSDLMKQEPMPV
ncbi:MAG: hypothetical protein EOP04_00780 [Proteobacteria bacterium]|nr:MAG: hypothetical protein EOP04_00780 [Pseudomonadota bacterium]